MDVVVLGGTRFIGAAIVEELVDQGHAVTVIHRGVTEANDLPDVTHEHLDRNDRDALRDAVRRIDPAAVIDTLAMSRGDAETLLAVTPPDARLVVLSSMDVYRAFGHVVKDLPPVDRVPLTEDSPLRPAELRYLYAGHEVAGRDVERYEKLDVEPLVTDRGGTILRLPMVYGERDEQFREGFVLRRIRAGRTTIPIGPGDWLWTRGYVRDVARAVARCAATDAAVGEVRNVGESSTWTMLQWMHHIAAAADAEIELVRVDDADLPDDLEITRARDQHVLVDSSRLVGEIGAYETEPTAALRASVQWHLARMTPDADVDWSADDAALATVG